MTDDVEAWFAELHRFADVHLFKDGKQSPMPGGAHAVGIAQFFAATKGAGAGSGPDDRTWTRDELYDGRTYRRR